MSSKFQEKLQRHLPGLFVFLKGIRFLYNPRSYLRTTGFMDSLATGRPVSPGGTPIPWMNYSVIHLLEARLNPSMRLFEYGSGYSTIFFASRVASVSAVESDATWIEEIRQQLPGNVAVVYQPEDLDGHYCRAIKAGENLFDVVIVDGRDRVNCVKQSIHSITETGVIILDDSQRTEYQPAMKFMDEQGFRSLTIEGLKPADFLTHETTIFYRYGNCLGL